MNNNGQQQPGLGRLGRQHVIFADTKVDTTSQPLQQLANQHRDNKALIADRKRSSADSLEVVKDKKAFRTCMTNEGKQIRRRSSELRRLLVESEEQEVENREDVQIADADVDLAVEEAEEEFQELEEAQDRDRRNRRAAKFVAGGQALIDRISDTVEVKGKGLVEDDVRGAVNAATEKILDQSELGRRPDRDMNRHSNEALIDMLNRLVPEFRDVIWAWLCQAKPNYALFGTRSKALIQATVFTGFDVNRRDEIAMTDLIVFNLIFNNMTIITVNNNDVHISEEGVAVMNGL